METRGAAAPRRAAGDFRVCASGRPKRMFSRAEARKDHRILRTRATDCRKTALATRRAGNTIKGLTAPRRGHRTAGINWMIVVLPAPDGPNKSDRFTGVNRQINPVQRLNAGARAGVGEMPFSRQCALRRVGSNVGFRVVARCLRCAEFDQDAPVAPAARCNSPKSRTGRANPLRP